MKRQWWLTWIVSFGANGAGILFLVGGCGSQPASPPLAEQPPEPAAPVVQNSPASAIEDDLNSLAASAPADFSQPMTTPQPRPLTVPHLIPPTASLERLPQVSVGRPDPFAGITSVSTVVAPPRRSAPPLPSALPLAAVPPLVDPAPAPPLLPAPLPALQPAAIDFPPLPPLSLPERVAPPLNAAHSIEISGVVQTGNHTSIIVKVPEERTSRHVGVGDYLAGGQVLVKRVEMGAEPVVILEMNGEEYTRSVGDGGSAMMGSL